MWVSLGKVTVLMDPEQLKPILFEGSQLETRPHRAVVMCFMVFIDWFRSAILSCCIGLLPSFGCKGVFFLHFLPAFGPILCRCFTFRLSFWDEPARKSREEVPAVCLENFGPLQGLFKDNTSSVVFYDLKLFFGGFSLLKMTKTKKFKLFYEGN